MKVALFEYSENHVSLLTGWLCVLHAIGCEIVLFCPQELDARLNTPNGNRVRVEKHVWAREKNVSSALSGIRHRLLQGDIDLLVILTLQRHFLFLLRLKTYVPTLITLHNVRTWFTPTVTAHPKPLLRTAFRLLWRHWATGYVVNSDSMKQSAIELYGGKKPVGVFPFAVKTAMRETPTQSSKFTVVYPGMVSTTRKRYQTFFTLAKTFSDVTFVLLGQPEFVSMGDYILNEIAVQRLSNLVYFESRVSDSTFDHWMRHAHVVFSDININYRLSEYCETYGRTKDSGVSYLMLEYETPGMFNSEFANLPALKEGTLQFHSDQNAIELLRRLRSDPAYHSALKKSVREGAKSFMVDNVAGNVASFLKNFERPRA